MKKNVLICVIALYTFGIALTYNLYANIKKELAIKNEYINNLESKYIAVRPQFEFNINNLGYGIDTSTVLTDTAKMQYKLLDLVQGNNMTFICRYSDDCCRECVDYAIHILINQVDTSFLGNILFVGTNENNRIFKKQTKDLGLSSYHAYNCISLNIPAEEVKYPYYMIVDGSLNVRAVYFPNKSASHLKIDRENVKLMYNAIRR